jgi:hypothetical protein
MAQIPALPAGKPEAADEQLRNRHSATFPLFSEKECQLMEDYAD